MKKFSLKKFLGKFKRSRDKNESAKETFKEFGKDSKKKIPSIDNIKNLFKKRLKPIVSKKSSDNSNFKDTLFILLKKLAPAKADQINPEEIITWIFLPSSRGRIHQVFVFCLSISLTYSVTKMLALTLSPKENATIKKPSFKLANRSQRTDFNTLTSVDPFKTKDQEVAKSDAKAPVKIDKNKKCLKAEKKSSLRIKLLYSSVLQDSVKSLASVQVRGKRTPVNVRSGDQIDTMAKVGKIERLKIIFKNLQNGECEYITSPDPYKTKNLKSTGKLLSKSAGLSALKKSKQNGIQNEGNNFRISKDVKTKLLSNLGTILTQAKGVPISNPDGTLHFKMTNIVPGSIYSQLNIQDDDIITSINGKTFRSLPEIMALYKQIGSIDEFEIKIKRNGSEQVMEYNFE